MPGIVYSFSFPDTTLSFLLGVWKNFIPSSEKYHCNSIVGESRSRVCAARPYRHFAIRTAPDFSFDFFRQFIQVSDLKSDHRFCGMALKPTIFFASFPRALGCVPQMDSLRGMQGINS